jgi:S1-C subfamily serine protease
MSVVDLFSPRVVSVVGTVVALAVTAVGSCGGAGVLKRFNLVFDYAGKRVIFEPNSLNALPDVCDRSGTWINRAGAGLKVADVTGGGPAEAAGRKCGDLIVAVDGVRVGDTTLVALLRRFRAEPDGTKIRLGVDSGGGKREVTLVLGNLI